LGRSCCWRRILKSEILASQRGLVEAGKEYLRHLLSPKQLALYRVVTRDAGRFPELGLEYQKLLVGGRTEILVAYLGRTARTNKWVLTSAQRAGAVYEALLLADLIEEILQGIRSPEPRAITKSACSAVTVMLRIIEAGILGTE